MAETSVVGETKVGEVGEYVVQAPIPPAQGAEEQKPIPGSADEATKATETEATAETAETTEQVEQKKQSKFQRRLDRQKTARVAAETEAKMLREQLSKLEAAKPQPDAGEPKREDFTDYEVYLRAVTRYDAEQAASKVVKTEREERQKVEGRTKETAAQDALAKNWQEREAAYQAATKDYIEVVSPFIEDGLGTLSDVARRAIAESEVGPQLLYHLGQNDEVAERIAELSPVRQVAELGKLEASFATPAKKVSSAPAPISQTKAGTSASQGYREGMSDAEYREWRKGQGARWAR